MDGYTVTCTHEFGQIRVQSMVGKPRHLLDVRGILLRLHNRQSQDVAYGHCILIVGLVKISFVKEKKTSRMLDLHVVKETLKIIPFLNRGRLGNGNGLMDGIRLLIFYFHNG